ncbi:hypothetical protein FEI14_06590 [Lacticaseibacillus zeae]|uniref:Uncharacterized protein n=1 Tax=Lacticaseibacillus zeae TaxID=57037 RepID=A0A5R8M2V6_LACZE|nr:hypothetical protein FEI14_06590 [Lacticaseibacillus zeae]
MTRFWSLRPRSLHAGFCASERVSVYCPDLRIPWYGNPCILENKFSCLLFQQFIKPVKIPA